MKKYFIDIKDKSLFSRNSTNATSKARADIERIADRMGYITIKLYSSSTTLKGCLYYFSYVLSAIRLILQFGKILRIKKSLILVQYPFLNYFFYLAIKLLKYNGNRIVYIIHDIGTERDGDQIAKDRRFIPYADALIVHTEEMRDLITKMFNYPINQIVILQFFDYLNSVKRHNEISNNAIEVVYAGNLYKSKFLTQIDEGMFSPGILYVYGKLSKDVSLPKCVDYKGTFEAENISDVMGNWGLVWDGESIDCCSGRFGDYLRINAPFKMSLYLAMGIPVIVWEKSAMAKYVELFNLGIVVSDLGKVVNSIKCLTTNQLADIQKGVEIYSKRVKEGKMFEDALDSAVGIIGNM